MQLFDIITQFAMITGNTVNRLNSEVTPGQTKAKAEGGTTTSEPVTGPNSDVTTDGQP